MKKFTAWLLVMTWLVCSAAFAEEVYRDKTISSGGYAITLHWDEALMPDAALEKEITTIFFDKYPAIRETFGTNEDRTFTVWLVEKLENGVVSRTTPEGVYLSCEYLSGSERGLNQLISHFFNMVMNWRPTTEDNGVIHVLGDGLAAYVENAYADNPDEAIWLIPYEEGQKLTDGHQVAGAFIKWIADTYGADVPVRLNRVLHEDSYMGDEFWVNAVGNTLENLWNEYASAASAE